MLNKINYINAGALAIYNILPHDNEMKEDFGSFLMIPAILGIIKGGHDFAKGNFFRAFTNLTLGTIVALTSLEDELLLPLILIPTCAMVGYCIKKSNNIEIDIPTDENSVQL